MNRKIIDGIFISLIVCLMFESIPKILYFRFLGGSITAKLVWIPLVIGLLYTLYCNCKYKNIFIDYGKFVKFVLVYLVIDLFSLLLGLYNYPFYSEIKINGMAQTILYSSIGEYFVNILTIDDKQFVVILHIINKIKNIYLETFWCFGGAYMIYCWYKNHYVEARNALFKGIIISAVILVFFGIVEIAKIFGNENAKQILINIAPFLHENATTSWGWPPKLWPNMRLVFCESSFMGNYLAFFMPCLYYLFYKKEGWYYLGFIYLFSFFTFLSKSRTCWALLFGAILLLSLCNLMWKNKKCFKKLLIVSMMTMLSFGTYLFFLDASAVYKSNLILTDKNINQQELVEINGFEELSNNMTNLASTTARSNSVRYAVMKANFRVFLEHPVLGVGSGLQSAYAANSYTEYEANLGEIKRWLEAYKNTGPFGKDVLQSGFNEYVDRLAQTGVLGTAAFLTPFLYIIIRMIKELLRIEGHRKIDIGFMLISLISLLVSGINVGLHIVYCIWVILGLSYVIVNEVSTVD